MLIKCHLFQFFGGGCELLKKLKNLSLSKHDEPYMGVCTVRSAEI